MKRTLLTLIAVVTTTIAAQETSLPPGYMPVEKSQAILEKTETIRLAPDLSPLTPGEREALKDLVAAGEIMQRLYENSRHPEALAAREELLHVHETTGRGPATSHLLELYRLSHGPVVTTFENKRETFLPVEPEQRGKNFYPWKITKEEIDAYLAAHPEERSELLGERTVVRRATLDQLQRDLVTLEKNPALATLHPHLASRLTQLGKSPSKSTLYAVPYAVAFPEQTQISKVLFSAAANVESTDPEFARYLRNRARDFLSDDYESGDAAWVTGHFKRLNAQIGAYETYDDALYGSKASHSMSILLLDEAATADLRKALGGLQDIENALPHENHRRVREDIPVGIYDVIADFGQARGTNTATILPNDFLFARRYGRTILMRRNIMVEPAIFAGSLRGWQAVMADGFDQHLQPEGNFYRTLWHEIGHYLGVDADKTGRPLDQALEDYADSLEEMKADLVSLFAHHRLHKKKMVSDDRLRAVRASGIRRTLQNTKPRRDQPYQTMQLAQFNYFLENGLLTFNPASKTLSVDYGRYDRVVTALLKEVLALQYNGDKTAASKFFDRYGTWKPELHEELAKKIREQEGARWRIVRYAALGE